MDEFKCSTCDSWKPNSEIGKTKKINVYGQNKCKACVASTTEADMETMKLVHDNDEDSRTWVRGCCDNCCNVDGLTIIKVGAKNKSLCGECAEEWEGKKQYRAQGVDTESKNVDMVARERYIREAVAKAIGIKEAIL